MKLYDRLDAARRLAKKLDKYKGKEIVVYALPRGGVVLGAEIAKHLAAPLDLIIPRKIGHPEYPEYAVCATTEAGYLICNPDEVALLSPNWLQKAAYSAQKEAKRQRKLYTTARPTVKIKGKMAILVDDGVATGLTMLAAIATIKAQKPSKIIPAIPIIPFDVAAELSKQVDEIMALEIAKNYQGSVGSYYRNFNQVEDAEVIRLLGQIA